MDNTTEENIEAVTMSDILQLSSWDRPRTSEELQDFISRHEMTLAENEK
jgi:hypothetical protein